MILPEFWQDGMYWGVPAHEAIFYQDAYCSSRHRLSHRIDTVQSIRGWRFLGLDITISIIESMDNLATMEYS